MFIAIFSLTVLGGSLGLFLGYAARRLAVEGNPLVEEIQAILPGSQCGQCGFPGCAGAAQALADGAAPVTLCPPGGREVVSLLAAKLGVEVNLADVKDAVPQIAEVQEDLCIGCTKCYKACPTDAIMGAAKQIHAVFREACTACGKCVDVCPTEATRLIPVPVTLAILVLDATGGGDMKTVGANSFAGVSLGVFARLAASMRINSHLHKLRGGVHPDGRKDLSAEPPIRVLPLPERLFVPLQQHVGAAARLSVVVGDRVLKGQLIGASGGNISAPVHAPTSGRVAAIGDFPSPHPPACPAPPSHRAGRRGSLDRSQRAGRPVQPVAEEIATRVGAAGIVGLGGATFPSAVKLNLSRKSGISTLIINGGECEPYLTCDDRLMRERADAIVEGIRLIAHATGARELLVGIEDNKPEAIAAMRRAAAGSEVQIRVVPAMYPMGWDKQMIQVLTGKEVPAEGRSAEIGVLVHNVATAWAVREAIRCGRPLVSRVVTVSGAAVAAPGNLEVPIGALASDLIKACGGLLSDPARLVLAAP